MGGDRAELLFDRGCDEDVIWPRGYRCLTETPLLCLEAQDFFDKRMSEHRDAAVLRYFAADDGEGSCSSNSHERKNKQQLVHTFCVRLG